MKLSAPNIELPYSDLLDDERILESRLSGALLKENKRYKLIDLFAGAGGMTLGFSASFGNQFVPVWANDFNTAAVATYNLNFGEHCTGGDIVGILDDPSTEIPKADVVIGGPPCQGFSLLNKNRDGDSRKQLWWPFLDVVDICEADIFVMENVPQLLGSLEYKSIINVAEGMGFKVVGTKLCAADYGVPQTRWRAFIIGSRLGNPADVFPPRKTHYDPKNGQRSFINLDRGEIAHSERWRTVRDAIEDLPLPTGTEIRDVDPPFNLHFGRNPTALSKKRYQAIPEEGMNRFDLQRVAPDLTPGCWIRKKTGGTDLFGRLWWNKPAFTIRTEFFKPEKGRYLHPVQHRPITHREAARLQSFPDSFRFVGSKTEIAKQIGNAVPPLLASRIADTVVALLKRNGR